MNVFILGLYVFGKFKEVFEKISHVCDVINIRDERRSWNKKP